jgi:hypothetical protein
VHQAFEQLGDSVGSDSDASRISIVVAGGVAGLLGNLLPPSRTTADVDVIWRGSDKEWQELAVAVKSVAATLSLPTNWLNRDCTQFAWCLPLDWQSRCQPVGRYGRLEVVRLGRFDLIASKLVSCPKRPQDVLDLQDLNPTPQEILELEAHLDRLQSEHPGGEEFEIQRQVLRSLANARKGASP